MTMNQDLERFAEKCIQKLEAFKALSKQRQSHECSFISKLELISFEKDHERVDFSESKTKPPVFQSPTATSKPTPPENKLVLRFCCVPESYLNSGGTVHGGALATWVDVTTSFAVWCFESGKNKGRSTVSVSLDVDYIGPALHDCDLYFEATVHKIGKTLAFATCQIKTEDGSLVVTASHTVAFVEFSPEGRLGVLNRSKL
jgi:uncharacterized protein (TIGR00369 family)